MKQTELQALWKQILAKLQESLNKEACRKWLKPCQPISLDDTTFTLGTPSDFYKDWINKHYLSLLDAALMDILHSPRKIDLQTLDLPVAPEEKPPHEDTPVQDILFTADAPSIETTVAAAVHSAPEQIAPGDSSTLNPKYTFENFVIGKSNQFPHAAALAVAERPGKVYNPLFMYGGVGLGKTHLMHAIGNRILKNHPEKRILYVSSEDFTNSLVRSIQNGETELFRQKYRTIDVLLIDDIQFLAGKSGTQEEFFHTFNTLYNAEKHIIISSDRPPKELGGLEERLISRFTAGLPVDIQTPDLETRIAILKKKAQLDSLTVPNDVMVYIATRIDSNIRELEGALTRVVAYSSLNQQTITTEVAADALKDIFPDGKAREITVELIQEIVASHFKIKVEDLNAKKRTQQIAFPRQIAMYLSRELTDTSLPQIGNIFGGRDHTTVIHACDKIQKLKDEDKKLSYTIRELMERIQKV